ncbi:MAG: HAD-IIIA family hydrolase [Planctomycetes bacterium]|nr:HAD-IIIA family hydrolase [Planctomycetota bacterium]
MTRAVFLDRDGTLVDELGFLRDAATLRLLPGAAEGVRLFNRAGWRTVLVTNQSGIARGLLDEDDLCAVHARLEQALARADARLDLLLHCPHHPSAGRGLLRQSCACRKPEPGMLLDAARRLELDLAQSWIVGDSARDLEAGRRAELAGGVLVLTGKGRDELAALAPAERARVLSAPDLPAAARLILQGK